MLSLSKNGLNRNDSILEISHFRTFSSFFPFPQILFAKHTGADINLPDSNGRTPLHVASAVDYPQMVEFLIEMGADIKTLTKSENQTPLHYAAKNDATGSLKVLLNHNAYIDARDYKNRTPLQVFKVLSLFRRL